MLNATLSPGITSPAATTRSIKKRMVLLKQYYGKNKAIDGQYDVNSFGHKDPEKLTLRDRALDRLARKCIEDRSFPHPFPTTLVYLLFTRVAQLMYLLSSNHIRLEHCTVERGR